MESRNCIERKELYRRISFLVVMLFSFTLLFAKGGTQQGIAYLYDYKTKTKKPIANVQLTVAGAKPTTSHADGTFTLVFELFGMGDKITHSKQPYYQGLKVFNKKEVDNWYIVKGKIRLIMCKYEEFELAKNTYYQLGMKAAKDKYDQQIRQIKANHKLKEAEMRQQLQEAEENYQRAMELMSESSEEMARIDQSELDDEMRAILDLYERGEVEEAMTRLDALDLKAKAERVLDVKHENEKKVEQDKQDSIAVFNSIPSAIKMCLNNNEFIKAGDYLKFLADNRKTPEDIFEYASFCAQQHNYMEGVAYYEKALEIYRRLSSVNPSAYEPDVARTLNNLANLYKNTQRYSDAELLFKEALEICRRLSAANPSVYEPNVARTLNNLAILYQHTRRYFDAEEMYKEVLKIYRRLSAANPSAYEPDVARTLNNLAALNHNTQRYSDAEEMYKEAQEIYRRLSSVNPSVYEPYVAMTLHNLANLYDDTQRYSDAEEMYKEALEIRRRLSAVNPSAYERDVARTLYNLALLYKNTQRFNEAQSLLQEARPLVEKYPSIGIDLQTIDEILESIK